MKKLTWLLLLALTFAGCKKNTSKCDFVESTVTATQAERTYIENYLATNSIAALQHPSGVFYTINSPGTGTTPNICSVIRVKYTGNLFSGAQFDAYTGASGISFNLGELIIGWQKGLSVIKSGGNITLYIPPSLGYGAMDRRDQNGVVVSPANSYLKFDIELMDVQ